MSVWTSLGEWAEKHRASLTITLLEAPEDQDVWVGQVAVMETVGAEVQGPLATAPFWGEDWGAVIQEGLGQNPTEAGLVVVNAGRRYYLAPLFHSRSALVLGGGHVGGAVCRLLRFLDFEVTLMDDRPEFLTGHGEGVTSVEGAYADLSRLFPLANFDAVIIVTRGHAQDTTCLRQALTWPHQPPYLGMIGSRRRTSETIKMLTEEGFSPDRLGQVRTPIGLTIGAQTPEEIAVSIGAEIIQILNQRAD